MLLEVGVGDVIEALAVGKGSDTKLVVELESAVKGIELSGFYKVTIIINK